MPTFKTTLSAGVIAGALAAAVLGLGAGAAGAEPVPPPPAPGGGYPSEPVPAWAPQKPAEFWNGSPVVWVSGWGGRWGVWQNGYFITLSSNPVTNGG